MSNAEVAATMLASYGSYPIASTLDLTDSSPELPQSEAPAYSAAFDTDPTAKRHAACDECRKRKLKCSGEPVGCDRCLKQKLTCHYSAQKQMGRPRKRQRTDDDPTHDEVPPANPSQPPPRRLAPPRVREPAVDLDLTEQEIERTNFQNICPGSMAQSIRRSASDARAAGDGTASASDTRDGSQRESQSSSNTSPYDAPRTPSDGIDGPGLLYPADIAHWPDFSEMTSLPVVVQDRGEREMPWSAGNKGTDGAPPLPAGIGPLPSYSFFNRGPGIDVSQLGTLATVPACPCLPNLYLTLSTLSTLSAFPVSSGMIDALLNAHRTCRAVIYCTVCPQRMQTGSQNMFLSTMLVTVLADHWHRVKKASAKELKLGFSCSEADPGENVEPMGMREDLEWRTYGYHLIRSLVFGDHEIPDPPYCSRALALKRKPQITPTHISSEESDTMTLYTLDSLVRALERRQKQWHDVAPYQNSNEFPPKMVGPLSGAAEAHAHGFPRGYTPGMTLEDLKRCEDEHKASGGTDESVLCLKIVKHSRTLMNSLEGSAPVIE